MNEDIKILVIEDEINIQEAIIAYLKKEKYITFSASDGETGLKYFNLYKPDLIILDLMLPIISGEELCKKIRKNSNVPIIMLTAKTTLEDKLEGFDVGADDYITKPFSPRELLARIKTILRRSSNIIQPLYNIMSFFNDDLIIDFNSIVVKKKQKVVFLTPNEFKILSLLAKYPNKVFQRNEIISLAFNDLYDGYDRTIDSHIKNIRAKIEDDSNNPKYILTIRGIGYKFYSGED